MALIERYFYFKWISEAEVRALDRARQVYGIWRLQLDEPNRAIRVEYDVSRLTNDDVAVLLRSAGIALRAGD